jgi:chorismate mutase
MKDNGLERFREEITAVDREIFAAVNRRLELVARLKRYKDEHGIAFVDPDREGRMLADRLGENTGPLSDEGLQAFHAELLALCKRELSD